MLSLTVSKSWHGTVRMWPCGPHWKLSPYAANGAPSVSESSRVADEVQTGQKRLYETITLTTARRERSDARDSDDIKGTGTEHYHFDRLRKKGVQVFRALSFICCCGNTHRLLYLVSSSQLRLKTCHEISSEIAKKTGEKKTCYMRPPKPTLVAQALILRMLYPHVRTKHAGTCSVTSLSTQPVLASCSRGWATMQHPPTVRSFAK